LRLSAPESLFLRGFPVFFQSGFGPPQPAYLR
jgi:hypothetical protein